MPEATRPVSKVRNEWTRRYVPDEGLDDVPRPIRWVRGIREKDMVEEPKNSSQMDWAFPLVSEWYGGVHGVGGKMHFRVRLKLIRRLDSLSACVGCPVLNRVFRPLRRKGLVAEANSLGQDVVHVGVGSV